MTDYKTARQQHLTDMLTHIQQQVYPIVWLAAGAAGILPHGRGAMFSGALRDKIHKLKYEGKAGWAMIFGRLLVGWMESHPEQMRGVDYVVGNPTHRGRQPLQHIEAIMDAAYAEDLTRAFPLSPPGAHRLVKQAETPRSANRTLDDKRADATAHAAARPGRAILATSRVPPSSSPTTSSPAVRSFSTSHSDSGRPGPLTYADSSSPGSPGADEPPAPRPGAGHRLQDRHERRQSAIVG
ncbi:hypothetical protein OG317_36750 [Streptomyces sp. NBC_01167]|uniref:hypothetical protein n=1 Tax=Streptomyces sp. NBC_01167 TaxID=2903756 RepID=UPI00386CA59C|nr:hypothetical protein OG317_36750 [Streptomyces sp. NBC_01167]